MRFATFSTLHSALQPALVKEDRIHPLSLPDLRAVIHAGAQTAARAMLEESFTLAEVKLHAPLTPASLRDAYAFEQHVRTASQNRGRDVPKEWYKFPVFYYTNHNTIFGPEDEIPYPHYTQSLDYELEAAVVHDGASQRRENVQRKFKGYLLVFRRNHRARFG
jgi:2-keto-4-pentenoate hydratase/2-oxohepta-3-ene-1,7-dioic acid hydratase in catechol pathway